MALFISQSQPRSIKPCYYLHTPQPYVFPLIIHWLTLGVHAQQGLRVCVCVSVKSHLTCGASVRRETSVTYSEVKIYVRFSLKPLPSKVMALFAYLWHPTAILQQYSA